METQKPNADAVKITLDAFTKLLETNPKACLEMINTRFEVADAEGAPGQVQKTGRGDKYQISMLGFINGILEKIPGTTERVGLIVDNGDPVGFTRVPIRKEAIA